MNTNRHTRSAEPLTKIIVESCEISQAESILHLHSAVPR